MNDFATSLQVKHGVMTHCVCINLIWCHWSDSIPQDILSWSRCDIYNCWSEYAPQDKHTIQSKRDIRTPGQILPIEVTSKARFSEAVGSRRHIGETEARGGDGSWRRSQRGDTGINTTPSWNRSVWAYFLSIFETSDMHRNIIQGKANQAGPITWINNQDLQYFALPMIE